MRDIVQVDGSSLTLDDVVAVARSGAPVSLDPGAARRVGASRALVERLLESGDRIYGVTTGFGRLANVAISAEQQQELQRNLVRSHAAGFGPYLSDDEVRAAMLLRANALVRGHSGCRLEVVEQLVGFLNEGIVPRVPELGSVGASGDLAPLAHVALCIMGEGEVRMGGRVVPSADALAAAGMEAVELAEKEGVALINGTQFTTGLGCLAASDFSRLVDAADVAGAVALEGLTGTPEPFRAEVHAVRPHAGQMRSAARLWAMLQGSEIRESHREGDPRVQDPYSLRCMPQVHGAAREVLGYVAGVLTREANSTTDNPLVLPEDDLVISGGNFHAQIVAQALDFLCIAAADLAAISERRTERLLNPDLSGLPAFLTPEPGIRSGFMIAQVAAVDALAEMRVLAHPVSVDSVSTSAAQEDHVSMGMAAARKLRRSLELLEAVLAIEMLCGAQAVEFRRPLRSSPTVEEALSTIREDVPGLTEDRVLSGDIERMRQRLRSGALSFGDRG